ncbi:NTP transferase domain-containing protein [Pendulispora albinea]|uniref:NTP transferase domain-containing protein n=1 Tax=Pendulispora albinea TaxID=2741071 RepID=A0ABZ2LL35_9BACT
MLIFIPMAGTGDRYIRAGYKQPKPLIPVDGAPMIERVLDAFPKEMRFLFGVNRTHAETTDLVPTLRRLRPDARIVVMEPHKDGPVQSVLSCAAELPDDEDVCLNYCDFGVTWSFEDFAAWLDRGQWDGAMTAYKGFHPHSLGPTLYAYMRSEGDRVTEIREKHHFTSNKFEEYASSGLYWFRRGRDLKRLAQELVARGERVNGEFYVSMLMQLLLEQKSKVGVYELERFFQWGTPEDLRDYESWGMAMRKLDAFAQAAADAGSDSAHVIPMAGRGQRFVDRGYADPKPLIDVAGRPMIHQAMACLPAPVSRVLVAQQEHARDARFQKTVATSERGAKAPIPTRVIELDRITEGQACTAQIGVEAGVSLDAPVLFAPCDTGYVYDLDRWLALERQPDCDVMLFTARGHLPAIWRPHMYGWLQVEDGIVRKVAVKKAVEGVPIADQEVITGTFWFKSARIFLRETAELIAANDRVNNEFYIDTIVRRMVERGDRVRAFTVDKYIPWGTPEELETFDYWNAVHRNGRPLGTSA